MREKSIPIVYLFCALKVLSYCVNANGQRWNESPHNGNEGKIAAGEDAKIEDFPYVVRLETNGALCTGAIIHISWVLTAAHCIKKNSRAADLKVTAGTDKVNDNTSVVLKGKFFTIHPNYWDGKLAKYDFALIEVEKPFNFSRKIAAVPLSDDVWPQNKTMYARMCRAAGWGTEEIGGHSSKRLKKLNVLAKHGSKGCKCTQSFMFEKLRGSAQIGITFGNSEGVNPKISVTSWGTVHPFMNIGKIKTAGYFAIESFSQGPKRKWLKSFQSTSFAISCRAPVTASFAN